MSHYFNSRPRTVKRWLLVAFAAVGLIVAAVVGLGFRGDITDPDGSQVSASSPEELSKVETLQVSDMLGRELMMPVSGRVMARQEAMVSAESGGKVEQLTVVAGQTVAAGETLARLEGSAEEIGLREARAGLRAQEASLEEARTGELPERIAMLEDQVKVAETELREAKRRAEDQVADARNNLLNNDLRAYLADERMRFKEDHSIDPPIISGNYEGSEEGEYRISLYRSNTPSGYSFRYQGPNGESKTGAVNTRVPQSLGSKGLSIRFPENFARNHNLEWVIPIPNPRGQGYIQAREAYEQAKKEAQPSVERAEANYTQAKKELNLVKSGTRREQIEALEAQVERARISVEAAENRLDSKRVTAPFAAEVVSVSTEVGEVVAAGQELFRLMGRSGLEFRIKLGPEQARRISTGNKVIIDDQYQGTVVNIARSLDRASGLVEVRVSIPETGSDLLAGEYRPAVVVTESDRNSIYLPLSAVETTGAGHAVYRIKEGRVQRTMVEVGEIKSDLIKITEGLELTDQVVKDASRAKDGAEVADR